MAKFSVSKQEYFELKLEIEAETEAEAWDKLWAMDQDKLEWHFIDSEVSLYCQDD